MQKENSLKKLQVILRLETVDRVKEALSSIGIGGATLMEVRGFGRQRGHTEIYRSQRMEVDFRSKMMLEIVMEEEKVDDAVKIILEHARTGAVGDGKIFILPVDNVIRSRPGESGTAAGSPFSAVTANGNRKTNGPASSPASRAEP